MPNDTNSFEKNNFFKLACYFESSLILVAIFLGWIADINPFSHLRYTEISVFYGLLGTAPLFLLFITMYQFEIPSVQNIKYLLIETLGPSLHKHHWADLFVLAAIAGVSEELLFRGVIQPWMEASLGMTAGLIGSNIIFGLVHAVTPLYAILATLIGIYLGLFLDYGGERNLLTPIIIHGLYDFLAFIVIIRAYRTQKQAH